MTTKIVWKEIINYKKNCPWLKGEEVSRLERERERDSGIHRKQSTILRNETKYLNVNYQMRHC